MRIRSPPLALNPDPNPNPNSLILIPYIFSQPYRSNPNRLTLPVYHNRLTLTLTLTLINSSPNPNPNQVRNDARDESALAAARKLATIASELLATDGAAPEPSELAPILARKVWARCGAPSPTPKPRP